MIAPFRQPAIASSETQDKILLAFAVSAAALINISIAATQVTLGLGIVPLLFWRRFKFPRIWIPLLLFFFWTVLADLLSPDPWNGWPYLRKAFVFLFIPLMYGGLVTQFRKIYILVVAWTASAAASALLGLIQYVDKYEHAQHTGENFYVSYLMRRITGFQGHWMAFGGLQLGALTIVLAHSFFSKRKMPLWVYGSTLTLFCLAILLSWDRGIWLAGIPVLIYLVWYWHPKLLIAMPLLVTLAFAVSPATTRARMESLVDPHGDIDSNRFRVVTFRTGLQMIEKHPWFGLGPDDVHRQFNAYVPADIRRPLPVGFYGHLHNIYVEFAAERGIPALLFLLWFIGLIVWDCVQGLRRVQQVRSNQLFVLHAAIGITIGILIGGLFEHNLGDSEVLMMFVCVIGVAYAALEHTATAAAGSASRA